MTIPSDLERIEAKHQPVFSTGEAYCSCGVNLLAEDCDVVKLARALDLIARAAKDDPMFAVAEAKRVLNEVAGGDDAE